MLGPPIGDFITTYANWHWIFFLNLPLGIAAFILARVWIENVRTKETRSFDWPSFMFASVASAGAVFAMEQFGGDGLRWRLPSLILAVSITSGVFAIIAARRRPQTSFVDLESMRAKTYSLSVFGASAYRISVSVLPFLLPLMFQHAFGLSAFDSGLYLFALFGGDLIMKIFVVKLLRRFSFRQILIVNGVLTAVSLALCGALSPATPVVLILALLCAHGAFRSVQLTAYTTLAYIEIPSARMSQANGFLSTIMQLTMGIAIGAVTLKVATAARGHSASSPQLGDFHFAISCVALLALASVFDTLNLSPTAGKHL